MSSRGALYSLAVWLRRCGGQDGAAAGGISDVSALKGLMADFYGMPPSLLRRSIETLVKRGKAQIIKGEGEAGEGVRFL